MKHYPRDDGCIVSWVQGGRDVVSFANGPVNDALREIVTLMGDGDYVEAISTPRTIARDLLGERRVARSRDLIDPWQAERALLGRIGRLDLLSPRAKAWVHYHLPHSNGAPSS